MIFKVVRIFYTPARGCFRLMCGMHLVVEMDISIAQSDMTIIATHIYDRQLQPGAIEHILNDIRLFAVARQLKVVVNCPVVHFQFMANETQYYSIWNRSGLRDVSEDTSANENQKIYLN